MPGVPELLAAWEAGQGMSEGQRVLLLHALARPGDGLDALLAATIGAREADLLALRRTLFGEQVALRASCPGCGAQQEFSLDVRDVIGAGPGDPAGPADPGEPVDSVAPEVGAGLGDSAGHAGPVDPAGPGKPVDSVAPEDPAGRVGGRPGAGECRVEADGWTVRFRPPTAADVSAAASATEAAADPGQARRVLLARCVTEASRDGRQVDPADLPEHVQERVAEAAAEADPLADIRLTMPCLECGQRTRAVFDIGSCLWAELDAWARGTLLDVHLLACSYGWTEADVLALSPLRRRYYLELAGHG